ncbi:ABC transporter ATP-binding protein [Solobacterium moorei]|uniref:ABC transporter ATP-binding protein n=1 Tax=Solobacterium moorei TaxID=102148 RepID=UPI0024AE8226|nr:ABC transporter ATP-binding protein [Solobacterium moorei]MDI6414995.1 ABC transporter ATP-binding protein [Solobacterium moorei]
MSQLERMIKKSTLKYAMIAFGFCILSEIISLISPRLMQYIIDTVIPQRNMHTIILSILIFVSIPLLHICIKSIFNYFAIVFARNKGNEYAIQLMEKLIHQPLRFFDTHNSIELLTESGRELSNLLLFYIKDIPSYYSAILSSVIIFIILCSYHPVIGVFQILFLPLSIIPVRFIHIKLEGLVNNVLEKNAKNNQLKADIFKNIDYIKSNNLEIFYINKIKENNDAVVSVWGSVASMESLAGVWINGFMTSLFTGLSFGIVALLMMYTTQLTVGTIISVVSYCELLYSYLNTIFSTEIEKGKFKGEFTKTEELFELDSDTSRNQHPFSFKRAIQFHKVDFQYTNTRILKELTMVLPAHKWTVILGESGVGKSTILKLIEKFYTEYEGKIMVDDISLKDIDNHDLRSKVAYLSQSPSLFPGSIRSNLTVGNDTITDEMIWGVLETVNMKEYVSSLDDALDTDVFEAGKIMSTGQKQRLCIARALLRNVEIYLLDEITSNVDPENTQLILSYFKELSKDGKTIISVTHDREYIPFADVIYELCNGKDATIVSEIQ